MTALLPVADHSRVISFRGGPRYPHDHFGPTGFALYTPPRNTLDPRYATCVDHHPACDCREAEFAEEIREWRLQFQEARVAFDRFLVGHPTEVDEGVSCQCIGCKIARDAHIWPRWSA